MLLFRLLPLGLGVGDHEARADRQCGELIDGIAAGAPVRKLLLVEMIGHPRAPLDRNTPRLSRRRVSLKNNVSTALSQEHDFGVK